MFKRFLKCTMPCHDVPNHTRDRWFALQAFKCFCGKWTKGDLLGTLLVRLHPTPGCNTLHTNGAQSGFAFRRSLRHSTVCLGMLWTTAGGTGTIRFWSIQVPLWCGTAWVRHALGERLNAPLDSHYESKLLVGTSDYMYADRGPMGRSPL